MKIERAFTHAGMFHADDVMASVFSTILWPEATIERVRELPEDFNNLGTDVAFDIGGRVSLTEHVWDHHQTDADVRPDGLPYAAAGLLWRQLGIQVLQRLRVPEHLITYVYADIHRNLIRPIDAADNGVSEPAPDTLSLSACVSALNVAPNAPVAEVSGAFWRAIRVVRVFFAAFVDQAKRKAQAKSQVLAAHTACRGRVLILDAILPWQEHLTRRTDYEDLLYVIQPSARGGYTVQQVPVCPGSFAGRRPLPESWAGKRGRSLAEAAGVELEQPDSSSVFCHPGRFIAGAETPKDILRLAEAAMA